jgi:hypothetical protein
MAQTTTSRDSRLTGSPRRSRAATNTAVTASATRWLLLIHQIPPKPDYLRVKIGRRLQRVGAIAIKNSVYVLPPTSDAYEDFQWIVREIEEGGGEAFISEASLVGEGLTDEDVRARFVAARSDEYRAMLSDARALLKGVRALARVRTPKTKSAAARAQTNGGTPDVETELARLRRRYEAVSAIDFFSASDGAAVVAALSEIQRAVQEQRAERRSASASTRIDGATWVTRRDVHVDRIASAWLIRRFIDRRPHFRFVDPKRYAHAPGELRFDMFEAEYTHVGDACSFETLVREFVPGDTALREIGEIVHDVDCKDAKFRRDEAAGLARLIAGIAGRFDRDEDRLERGRALFDDLYAAFHAARA